MTRYSTIMSHLPRSIILTKIGQSLLCTGSSIQNPTCTEHSNMAHPRPNIIQMASPGLLKCKKNDHIGSIYPCSLKTYKIIFKTIHKSLITPLLQILHIRTRLFQNILQNGNKAKCRPSSQMRPRMSVVHLCLSYT